MPTIPFDINICQMDTFELPSPSPAVQTNGSEAARYHRILPSAIAQE